MLEKKGTNWPFQFETRPVEGGGCKGQSDTVNNYISVLRRSTESVGFIYSTLTIDSSWDGNENCFIFLRQ